MRQVTDGLPGAPDGDDAARGSMTVRGGVCLAATVVLHLLRPPFELARPCLMGVSIGVLLLALALMARGAAAGEHPVWSIEGPRLSVPVRLLEAMALFVVAVCVGAAWSMGGTASTGLSLPVFLLASAALGIRAEEGWRIGSARYLASAMVHGADELLLGVPGLLAFAVPCLALGRQVAEWGEGLPFFLVEVSTVVLCAYALFAVIRESLAEPERARVAGEGRLMAYLRGRGLGETESKVILLTAQGWTRQEVCDRLGISAGTVNSHRASGYRKLGVHNKGELLALLASDAMPPRKPAA